MKKSPSDTLHRAHSRGSFSRLVFESETNNGGGHRDRSLLFRFCQVFVILLRLVTPCSYIFLVSLIIFQWKPKQFGGVLPFTVIISCMCMEALFFPYYYYLFSRLNKQASKLQHFALNRSSRMRLVKNCFEALRLAGPNPEIHVREALKGWFLDVPLNTIKRGNLESWSAWAFIGKNIVSLSTEEQQDNQEIVNYIEEQAQWKFPEGFQEDSPSVRLDLDPIFATQRPLLFYATIAAVNMLNHVGLYFLGFRKRYDVSTSAQLIYYRKGSGARTGHADTNHANTSHAVYPLVFIHGIGIGYAHYIAFVSNLPTEVDVYLLEWPHVAMQMASSAPDIEESVSAVVKAFDIDGHKKACLVAHSLGNTFISWMLHHPVACKRVYSTVLVDPVTFLLCDPTVATTVIYKEPSTTMDFLMHFFVARELFIANALSRHFNWSHNIVFVEDLSAVDSYDVNAYSPSHTPNQSEHHTNTGDTGGTATSDTSDILVNSKQCVKLLSSSATDTAEALASKVSRAEAANRFDLKAMNPYALNSVPHLQMRHTIVFSSKDTIVPVNAALLYLQAKARQGHTCFEILTFNGTHGEVFLHCKWVRLLTDKVRLHCGLIVVIDSTINKRNNNSNSNSSNNSSQTQTLQVTKHSNDINSNSNSNSNSNNLITLKGKQKSH